MGQWFKNRLPDLNLTCLIFLGGICDPLYGSFFFVAEPEPKINNKCSAIVVFLFFYCS